MATIRTPNELNFMQSFDFDPEKQIYDIVRVPEEIDHDISSLRWKNDSITFKRFLVYIDKKTICFTILQKNETPLIPLQFYKNKHFQKMPR